MLAVVGIAAGMKAAGGEKGGDMVDIMGDSFVMGGHEKSGAPGTRNVDLDVWPPSPRRTRIRPASSPPHIHVRGHKYSYRMRIPCKSPPPARVLPGWFPAICLKSAGQHSIFPVKLPKKAHAPLCDAQCLLGP